MKVIDLLNKIANGEEVPKKIKYKSIVLYYHEEEQDYEKYWGSYLFEYLFKMYDTKAFINDEIEIIEEPKKIETLSGQVNIIQDDINPRRQDVMFENCLNDIVVKINEIIDYINKGDNNE